MDTFDDCSSSPKRDVHMKSCSTNNLHNVEHGSAGKVIPMKRYRCTLKRHAHSQEHQCQECDRPGVRYLIDGQYLYFCDFHIGYYALAFQQYAMPAQPQQQSGGEV
jgi:hypothetical protein